METSNLIISTGSFLIVAELIFILYRLFFSDRNNQTDNFTDKFIDTTIETPVSCKDVSPYVSNAMEESAKITVDKSVEESKSWDFDEEIDDFCDSYFSTSNESSMYLKYFVKGCKKEVFVKRSQELIETYLLPKETLAFKYLRLVEFGINLYLKELGKSLDNLEKQYRIVEPSWQTWKQGVQYLAIIPSRKYVDETIVRKAIDVSFLPTALYSISVIILNTLVEATAKVAVKTATNTAVKITASNYFSTALTVAYGPIGWSALAGYIIFDAHCKKMKNKQKVKKQLEKHLPVIIEDLTKQVIKKAIHEIDKDIVKKSKKSPSVYHLENCFNLDSQNV